MNIIRREVKKKYSENDRASDEQYILLVVIIN